MNRCPKCNSEAIKTFTGYVEFSCRSDYTEARGEPSFWQSELCKSRSKDAELTKLKADVERLRGTVKEVHDRMHYLLEPDDDGELDMREVRGCVEDYLGMLSRALEETKP